MDDRAKASLILRDFLRSQTLQGEGNEVYNPEANDWQAQPNNNRSLLPVPPNPMKKLWYTLPDFFDDQLIRFLQYQQGIR